MKKQRKQLHAARKVVIVRRHLRNKERISKLCVGVQPTVFYRWQKEFFENRAAAFEQKARPNDSAEQAGSPTCRRRSIQVAESDVGQLADQIQERLTFCEVFRE
jgi:transposase-like protein